MVELETLYKLLKSDVNSLREIEEALRLLRKIGENIIKHPFFNKYRTLRKSNETIANNILGVKGAKQCLIEMGFEEKDETFEFPEMPASFKDVENFVTTLDGITNGKLRSSSKSRSSTETQSTSSDNIVLIAIENIERIILPSFNFTHTNGFLRRMEIYAQNVLRYEDKALQAKTRKLIPISALEANAQKRLRNIENYAKQNKIEDTPLSIQDVLLLELLQWFKEDFFTWVDTPICDDCGQSTTFSFTTSNSKPLASHNKVEMYTCTKCKKLTPFHRYNDPGILLETRKGRCGEWANAFTLCCRAMGWDARYVISETDHVWTEVYSDAQKRWLHCDPCENMCDTPLIYELGWKKKLSYVMAYSAEEVQDVTWRYSCHHAEVLSRRVLVSEKELLDAIMSMRKKMQENLSPARKAYLLNRVLSETVEFLTERKPKSDEFKGRTSGADVWRIARGEIQNQEIQENQHTWVCNSKEDSCDFAILKYSSALNKYQWILGDNCFETEGWQNGAFQVVDIFRKVEKDWKMAYLARREHASTGSIKWRFDFSNSKKSVKEIQIKFNWQTYHNGNVQVQICTDNTCIKLSKAEEIIEGSVLGDPRRISIIATVSEGMGDMAWQHAQLLRQSLDSTDFNFYVKFSLQ